MYAVKLCLTCLQLQQLLITFRTTLCWFYFVYCLWKYSYNNSPQKYSFKYEVSLLASMLTCMKSNLLNSRFIASEVHEGKSLEVEAGTSLFQNLSLSHKLLTQSANIPRTAQKVQVSQSSLSQSLFWEVGCVDTIFDYVSSCADGFSLNFCSLESQKNISFFTSKTSTALLFLRKFVLLCLCFFYTWLPADIIPISFVSYETTLQTWSFDFSHIISQKHSIDFYVCQHKHQCYMFILLKWAVAVEEIEKQRDTVRTSAQIARYRMVPTTALLTHSFLLYWSHALGMTGNLALAKSSHFPAEKKKEYKISFVLCLHLHRPA